ncbi:MAG: NAD(P)-dependent alcohol dehydrogenase [Lewinellaceae bacterium]|nr:NAD(P)-dependent alcohol dehydrogenase [Lewinellaceae bacterium]
MNAPTMQAAVLTRYGSPDFIKIQDVQKPVPKANEVLVKVHATTVTAADTMMRRADPAIARLFLGFSRPRHNIMGTGFAGKVAAVGPGVKEFEKGDEVFGETGVGFSANAEYVIVAEDGVIDWMPPNISFEEAATLTDGPLTSFNFLKNLGKIKAGHSVLIIGASGSLGTAAVQLARYFGAHVTGVSSARNVELVKSLGADEVIDYTKVDFTQTGKKYDLIFDTVGKSSFSKSKKALTEHGLYLSPVLRFGLLLQMMWTSIFSSKKAKFDATGLRPPKLLRSYLDELAKLVETGKLGIVIDKKYPLAEADEAHRYVDTGRKRGNVVLLAAS